MKAYAIKEIFATLQGEGRYAGTSAIFIRFAGCNLWTGRPEHRARDAERHGASCPLWCDTDFADGRKMTADEAAEVAARRASDAGFTEVPLVVFTGGEPLLHLDRPMIEAVGLRLRGPGGAPPVHAVETNGTVALDDDLRPHLTWICVSPKTLPEQVELRSGDELKVVFPGGLCEPEEYARALGPFRHYYVSPQAAPVVDEVGVSSVSRDHMAAAAQYCMRHTQWRLSLQMHKIVDLP
jgi:7-carboxy-7-deazaguanine synthase